MAKKVNSMWASWSALELEPKRPRRLEREICVFDSARCRQSSYGKPITILDLQIRTWFHPARDTRSVAFDVISVAFDMNTPPKGPQV